MPACCALTGNIHLKSGAITPVKWYCPSNYAATITIREFAFDKLIRYNLAKKPMQVSAN